MRFYWKELPEDPAGGLACKIMRAVEFPFLFDAREFCTPEVQQAVTVAEGGVEDVDRSRYTGERGVSKVHRRVREGAKAAGRDLTFSSG